MNSLPWPTDTSRSLLCGPRVPLGVGESGSFPITSVETTAFWLDFASFAIRGVQTIDFSAELRLSAG
jgi:hypothetical protein